MGGLLSGTPANQAVVPQGNPVDKSGEFYLGHFGDSAIGRDSIPFLYPQVGSWMVKD